MENIPPAATAHNQSKRPSEDVAEAGKRVVSMHREMSPVPNGLKGHSKEKKPILQKQHKIHYNVHTHSGTKVFISENSHGDVQLGQRWAFHKKQ